MLKESIWTYLDLGEIVETSDNEVTVAILPVPDDEVGEMIAAGPLVLDALEALLMAVEVDKVLGIGHYTDAAKAAIRKARGRDWVGFKRD